MLRGVVQSILMGLLDGIVSATVSTEPMIDPSNRKMKAVRVTVFFMAFCGLRLKINAENGNKKPLNGSGTLC
jgi:hypothetical protein